ncbi:MAG: hypothetical protein CMF22_10525 [Idiomarinaceae bacterium]|nr:hypothetical protein [Idiomarinaceae bacterium]MBG23875.1 hypothetical protein [Idiomarinaceae bacterium]|tara:strand:- start:5633 stop:6550 length:918 start_codon:yes stop_codon:yes gene_type:complete
MTKIPDEFDICFIDCDLIKYRASFAAEKTEWLLYDNDEELVRAFYSAKEADDYVDNLWMMLDIDTSGYHREEKVTIKKKVHAIAACDHIIELIKRKCPAKEYRLYLTGNDTYRPHIATLHKYKGNRDGMRKPTYLQDVTDHIIEFHDATVVDYIEADDTLTVGLTWCRKKGLLGVVANLDKDIKQVEGWHYDWGKDKYEYVTAREGILHTYCQAIAGDAVDNYKGIPGIGMKKAMKLIQDCETEREMYETAVEAYREYFGEEYHYKSWDGKDMVKTPQELFLENMNLAFMQRKKGEFYQIPHKEK